MRICWTADRAVGLGAAMDDAFFEVNDTVHRVAGIAWLFGLLEDS